MNQPPRSRTRPRTAALGALALAALAVAMIAVTGGGARSQVAPSNTVEPTISGSAVVGQTLTANNGTWTGTAPITFTYQWLRCDSSGGNCQEISGGTGKTYVVQAADNTTRLRVRVTATNTDGNATALANPTPAVTVSQSGAPDNLAAPSISGTVATFSVLAAAPGLWAGAQPISYGFQWLRCDASGNNCVDIAGAVTDSYTPKDADVDRTLRVRVRATNTSGNASENSAATVRVVRGTAPLPPGAVTLPSGLVSIPVTSVPNEESLIVEFVQFSPSPVTSRSTPINARIRIRDTRGYAIREAFVFFRSTPVVTDTPTDGQTAQDGTITYRVMPQSDFPIKNGYAVQFYVKAYRKGDPALGGIAGTRLVQVRTQRP